MNKSFSRQFAALAAVLFFSLSLGAAAETAGVTSLGTTDYGRDTFTRVGASTGVAGENDFTCGVIDEANGYAYFGTNTSPGKVVKMALGSGDAAPSRVGVLTLNSGENQLTSAFIDAANGYAYFGTNTAPGIVVKVALGSGGAAPTRVGALTLNAGENYLKCAAANTSTGYAFFGTYTSPGIAVKVALGSGAAAPTRVGAVTLNSGEDLFTCAVLNTSDQWAWFGTDTAPGMAVGVFLGIGANMPERITAIPFNAGENNITGAYIDMENDTGYFVTGTAPASIVIVDFYFWNRDAAVALAAGESPVSCCAFDPGRRWGFFGTNTSPAKVAKTVFGSRTDAATLGAGENQARCVLADPESGYVYVGTGTSPAQVVKLKNTQMKSLREIGSAAGLNASDIVCGVIDTTNGYAYFGTQTFPGRVVKVALGTGDAAPVRVGEVGFIDGEDNVYCAAIDPANGYAYFGTYHAQVIKVALGSGDNPPTRIGAITLGDGMYDLQCALIDTSTGYLYFGGNMSPAAVAKVAVGSGSSLPTHVATLHLSESQIYSGVIDPGNGYAYFGTYRAPGQVIKVALGSGASAPTYVGALTLEGGAPGEDYLISAAIDPTNGYAYFGTGTVNFSRIVKVALGTGSNLPTRIGSLIPACNANYYNSAILDTTSQMAYFTSENPPEVVKIALGSGATLPSYVGYLSLGGSGTPRCIVGDIANGYAYVGYDVTAGRVSKVSLGSGTNLPTLTAESDFGGPENIFRNVILDEASGRAYTVATSANGGALTKFAMGGVVDGPTRLGGALGTQNAGAAFVDPANDAAYVVMMLGLTLRYSLGDGLNPPMYLGWSALSWGGVGIPSAAFDETSGYAYYGAYLSPGIIYKVDPSGTDVLTPVIGTLTLDSGEDQVWGVAVDPASGYGYAALRTTPAKIVKFALGSGTAAPTRVGALDLNVDDGLVVSLQLDGANGHLYALSGNEGMQQILKIAVGAGTALPTRIGAMKIGDSVISGGLPFLDGANGIGYAIADNTLVKYALGTGSALPTRMGTFPLYDASGNFFSSAMDASAGYAYLGTDGFPGVLHKYAVSWKDAVHGTKMTLTQKASVNDIRLYSHQAGGNVRMAIYDDNGSARTLKWESASIANNQTEGWITAAISSGTPSSLILQPGTYWVAFNTDSPDNWQSFAEAGAGNGFELNQAYGAFPGSITNSATTEMNGVFSQYITYTNYVNLTVASAYDSPSPAVGVTEYLSGGAVNASVTSPVSGGAGIRYVCTGYTGTGSAPSGSGTSCSFAITQASTLTWNWKTQYQLTTAVLPSGAGSVTPANGTWIDAGTVQSVQASNNTGWQFGSWSGALSGSTNPQNLTMNSAKSVTANFNPQLTIASAYGSPSPAVGSSYPTYNSTVNASVTSPVSGGAGIRYVCTGYTGTGSAPSGSGTSCSFTITQASTLTWNWKTQYQLTTAVSPSGTGSVTPANGTWIDAGTVQSVQASNNAGWQFGSWSGALSGSTNPQNLTMDAAKSVTAYFNPQLTIASAYGSPSPSVGTTYPAFNSTVIASVTSPVSGGAGIQYVCTGYTGTGSAPSGSGTSCSFTITQASTLTWNWKTQYQLTTAVSPSGTGSVTPANGTWIDAGTVQSVQASNNTGWQFGSWSGDLSGSTNPTNLTMDAAKSVTANFNPQLTIASAYGSPSPSIGTTYPTYNSTVNASVTSPVSGGAGIRYVCTGYTGSGSAPSGSGTSCSFTITQASTLTWNWKTQYQLTTAVSPVGGGLVTPANGTWIDAGTVQSVQAVYTTSWQFGSWSGDLSGSANPTNLTMDAAKSVTASFNPMLQITSAYGSPSPAVGTSYPTYNSTVNASVTSPISGGAGIRYVCTGYTGSGSAPSGSGTSCSFTISYPSTLTWNWKTQYQLTSSVSPAGTGTTAPADGTWIDAGTLQSVEAVGNPGWQLGSWSGDLSGSMNPQDLTMDAPKSVSASFNPALTVLSDHGMPSPSVGTFYPAYNLTLEATVNSPVDGDAGVRYVCTGYTGTGDVPASGTDLSCNFTLTQPSTLTWNWKTQYQLRYTAWFHGTIQGDSPQWVDGGASGTEVLAVADPGYTFVDWSDLSTQNPRTDTNVTGPIAVSAGFEDRTTPTSTLAVPADRTVVGPSISLSYTASDQGSGLAFVTLWVKAPGSDTFIDTGMMAFGESGAFDYTFTAGDGAYEFATKAFDATQNAEADPVTPSVVVYVNDIENSAYTWTLSSADAVTTFPMTNDLDMIIAIAGATPGSTITVSRTVGDTAPAGYDPASFIDEHLTITGTGLGMAWTATLTWNFDPASDTLGAALDTLYQFDGPGNYTRRWTITPSGSTITIGDLTSFSDWYAGEIIAPSEVGDWKLIK